MLCLRSIVVQRLAVQATLIVCVSEERSGITMATVPELWILKENTKEF